MRQQSLFETTAHTGAYGQPVEAPVPLNPTVEPGDAPGWVSSTGSSWTCFVAAPRPARSCPRRSASVTAPGSANSARPGT